MRQIKFRARFRKISTGQEIWQFLSISRNNICDPRTSLPSGYIQTTDWEQLTGLHDKHGNEIYEGDIISVRDPYYDDWSKDGAEVIFSLEYVGGWVISSGGINLNLGTRQNHIKIIGNIHDNPELLEGKN